MELPISDLRMMSQQGRAVGGCAKPACLGTNSGRQGRHRHCNRAWRRSSQCNAASAHCWHNLVPQLAGGAECRKLKPSRQPPHLKLSDLPAAGWEVASGEIEVCRQPDGSEWLLGEGRYGKTYKALKGSVQVRSLYAHMVAQRHGSWRILLPP